MSLVFAHVLQRSHALLKSCAGSTDNLLSEPCFFSSAVSSDPPLCPLLIFHEKKKKTKKIPRFQLSAGCRGISEQPMRRASVKEAAAGPSDVGEGENLSMNPTIYPVQAAENRGKVPYFHFSSHQ